MGSSVATEAKSLQVAHRGKVCRARREARDRLKLVGDGHDSLSWLHDSTQTQLRMSGSCPYESLLLCLTVCLFHVAAKSVQSSTCTVRQHLRIRLPRGHRGTQLQNLVDT